MSELDKAEVYIKKEPMHGSFLDSEPTPGVDMGKALHCALNLTLIEAPVSSVIIAVTNKIVAAYQSSRGVSSSV